MKEANESMLKTFDLFKRQIIGIGPDIDDSIMQNLRIGYHAQPTPLQHLCSFAKKDRQVSVTPFDPQILGSVEDVLKEHGFEAYKFSKNTIMVNIPIASGEVLKKIKAHKDRLAEEARVAIRNTRRKYRTKENDKEVQDLTDYYIKAIDRMVES